MSSSLEVERTGLVTFKGSPMTLVGHAVNEGDTAPDFNLVSTEMQPVTLNDALAGHTRAALLIVVPSIDTSVCSLETIRFNKEVAALPTDRFAAYTISVDLPFAQKRWGAESNVRIVQLLSDYKTHKFGPSYGVLIKELGLLARSIFLVDKGGIVRLAQIMPEVALEPDYSAILAKSREIVG